MNFSLEEKMNGIKKCRGFTIGSELFLSLFNIRFEREKNVFKYH